MKDNHEILTLIIEDDPLNSTMLRDLLRDHFPNIRVAGIAASIAEAKPLLKCLDIDLLFLDIELPDGKGFDLLSTLPEVNFEVIVTTSYSSYALDAIQYSALDYIMKPVSTADLSKAIERYTWKLMHHQTGNSRISNPWSLFHRLPLPTSEGIVFVNTDEIVHAEADGVYTVFKLKQGKNIMVSRPLCDFEERLISRNFFRIHNSHIINLAEVAKFVRGEGSHVVMTNNSSVPVSRSRKEEFLNLIGC
jgi:two-component system, LytTR family, response regulator